MRTNTQSRFYDKLDLEGKQKEELKMAQKCHFNQIVVFHQLYWIIPLYTLFPILSIDWEELCRIIYMHIVFFSSLEQHEEGTIFPSEIKVIAQSNDII